MKKLLGFGLLALLFCSPAPSDKPIDNLFSPTNLEKAELDNVEMSAGPTSNSITLKFPSSETYSGIVIPVPQGARDWSKIGTLTFDSTSSSTIRYSLTIRNAQGETFRYVMHPYQDVSVRVAIPGRFLTTDYMNNRQFKGYWLSNWGNHIDLSQVESIQIQMAPNREVSLTLGNFSIVQEEVEDEILSPGPMVDEFGQWIGLEWGGKIDSAEQLKEVWSAEEGQLQEEPDFGFSKFGGWQKRKERATGFFHTAEVDGRWWLVDPEGYLFYSVGMDCVRYRSSTRVSGREKLFAKLPPESGERTDFYRANIELRYQDDFVQDWKQMQSKRLRSWGFNTVANWSDPATWKDPSVPFVINLNIGRSGKNWHRFPDVYSAEFQETIVREAAEQCSPYKNEPYLLGYFIGNEERWPHRHFIDLILEDPTPTATQSFVQKYFEEHGDNSETREALTETMARHYFKSICEAIKKADPNHLILGVRWAGGRAPDSVMKANDVFDVFSINYYRFQPSAERIEHLHKLTGRPLMIGEFHFGAVDRGYAPALVMVKNQKERGVAYQYYVEQAASTPALVGAHYFQYVDQPVSGRFDGENYNFGFVNQLDIPYAEMLEFARATHQRIYQVHAGELEPTNQKALIR
jgi:hypothetical protein